MKKEELLNTLKEINKVYLESKEVLEEIKEIEVEDKYVRKYKTPKKPEEPKYMDEPEFEYVDKSKMIKETKFFIKTPIGFLIASVFQLIAYFIAKSGIDDTDSLSNQFQIKFTNFALSFTFVLLGVALLFGVFNIFKYLKTIKDYKFKYSFNSSHYRSALEEYEKYQEAKKKYDEEMKEYNKKMNECLTEEESIQEKLNIEKEEIQEKLKKEKYDPLMDEISELMPLELNMINFPYSDLSRIIDILETGRADTFKEALNVLDEIKYREEQQEFERYKFKKEEQARRRQENEERERYEREKWEEESRRKEDIRRAEKQREEDKKYEERRAREEKSRNHQAALRQCGNCLNAHGCRNYAKFANCPNYRHR